MLCGFKDQVSARPSNDKCGLYSYVRTRGQSTNDTYISRSYALTPLRVLLFGLLTRISHRDHGSRRRIRVRKRRSGAKSVAIATV